MKGTLFIEFLRFAEHAHGAAVAARLRPPHRYRSSSTYAASELHALAAALAAEIGETAATVLRHFGRDLFPTLAGLYPIFFHGVDSALAFLERTDRLVHSELIKMIPDAEFPRFVIKRHGAHRLEMTYHSRRALADFAEGLMLGCGDYFATPLHIQRDELSSSGDESVVRFQLSDQAAKATHK
jgi:Haem-NO-binding